MTVQDANEDGTCPDCGAVLMISNCVRVEGSVVIAKHCDKEWRLLTTESNAKLVLELSKTLKVLESVTELAEASIK